MSMRQEVVFGSYSVIRKQKIDLYPFILNARTVVVSCPSVSRGAIGIVPTHCGGDGQGALRYIHGWLRLLA